jgi:hypothetical protein
MFSIYVPRVLNEHTVDSVANIMTHFRVGVVHQVDFTPINKKPGFYEEFDNTFKSAFIHFIDVPGYQMNIDFWIALKDNHDENCKTQPQARLQISHKEYWICLKNQSPIQRTMMNIHQVVENGRYLEDRIKTLEDSNKLLQDSNKLLQDSNKLLQDNYTNLLQQFARLQDQFDKFITPMTIPPKLERSQTYYDETPDYNETTCDTWNTDTQDNNEITCDTWNTDTTHDNENDNDWKILNKSQFTKQQLQDMSPKDILMYYKYEHNWAYDKALDR